MRCDTSCAGLNGSRYGQPCRELQVTTSALAMLRASVVAATSPGSKAEALARVGVCLAQLGRFEEARDILLELRKEYSTGHFPRVLIRIMIFEGIISYYENLVNSSDRLRRAHILSKVGGITDLQAESSVWMAHFAFNFENYSEFGLSLSDAINKFEILDDSCRARTCLLVADALQYLANRSAASDWYILARILCRRAHDHGLMTAIEYNRLGIGLSRIRVDRALGRVDNSSDHRDWLAELGSVKRLHVGFDARALAELLELCDAYTHEISGDYSSACTVLERIRDSGSAARCGVSDCLLTLEIEWCRVKNSGVSSSNEYLGVDISDIESLTQNDRLIALMMIKDAFGDARSTLDADWYTHLIDEAMRHFDQTVSDMSAAIEVTQKSYSIIHSLVMNK